MEGTCRVVKNGNSATVVLPAEWRKEQHIEAGDKLVFSCGSNGWITFRKPRSGGRARAVADLLDVIDSTPFVPWERGDSPQDDRDLLAERYE